MLTGLFQYRGFIWQHALAELRHRYAGTGLGVVWNVLHPLALIAVFSVVFTSVFRVQDVEGRAPYILYLCAGLLPWLAFSECVTRGCLAFTDNATYLKKLPVPEQVFVAGSAASATMGLAVSFSLLVVISLALGLRPTWHWLLLPVPLVLMQMLGFGLGLICGTLNVFFRDIGQFLVVALQVVMWTAPVVYVVSDALPRWVRAAFPWHPLVPPLEAIRALFLFHRLPDAATWIGLLAWPALALVLAYAVFHPLRAEIRDNV